jgi:hypothetical protein
LPPPTPATAIDCHLNHTLCTPATAIDYCLLVVCLPGRHLLHMQLPPIQPLLQLQALHCHRPVQQEDHCACALLESGGHRASPRASPLHCAGNDQAKPCPVQRTPAGRCAGRAGNRSCSSQLCCMIVLCLQVVGKRAAPAGASLSKRGHCLRIE